MAGRAPARLAFDLRLIEQAAGSSFSQQFAVALVKKSFRGEAHHRFFPLSASSPVISPVDQRSGFGWFSLFAILGLSTGEIID